MLSASALALAGCGASLGSSAVTTEPAAIAGSLHGGQQPVSGALVQLIAPGTVGYGLPGTVIASATSQSDGTFTLPRPYTCPANSGLVYLLATGGDAGAGSNSHIGLAAIVGDCSSLQATDFFQVNEVTTVAAAYALAPFATVGSGVASIGTSATNLQGLVNAGAAAAALADVHTGLARDASALPGVVLPTAEVNLIANILAGCVNDNTQDSGSGTCATLFNATSPSANSFPLDTFQAAINIALHPGVNVDTLVGLQSGFAPFQPALTPAPNDFALGILFNTSAIANSYAGPAGIDIDASGNAWVAVYTSASSYSALFELSPGGSYLNGATGQTVTGLLQPEGIAVTPTGKILVSDFYDDDIYLVTPAGSSSVLPASSTSFALDLAVDARDNSIWTANEGTNTASHLSSTGADITGSPYAAGSYPAGVAISGSGDVWVTNPDAFDSGYPNSSLTHLTRNNDSTYTATNINTGAGTIPYGIAIDNTGNAWVGFANSLAKYSSTGALLSPTGGYVTDSTDPDHTSTGGIQIDGLGRAIVSNGPSSAKSTPGSLTIFDSDGTYLSKSAAGYGYTLNGILPGYNLVSRCLAIDGSGNVWIAGQQANQLGGSSVVMVIGAVAPVVTPLSAATSPNRLGIRP